MSGPVKLMVGAPGEVSYCNQFFSYIYVASNVI